MVSLPLVMTAAVVGLRLGPSEALVATTVNAAAALGLADRGALAPGLRADLAVWDVPTHAQIPYWAGADLVRTMVGAAASSPGALAETGRRRPGMAVGGYDLAARTRGGPWSSPRAGRSR